MKNPETPNTHRAKPPRPSVPRWVVVASTVFLALGTSALGFCLPQWTSSFAEMFDDLGRPIPELTQRLIQVPAAVWWATGLIVGVGLLVKDLTLKPSPALFVNGVAFVVSGAFVTALVIGLFEPLLEIIRRIK